jgi:hypothetical protein
MYHHREIYFVHTHYNSDYYQTIGFYTLPEAEKYARKMKSRSIKAIISTIYIYRTADMVPRQVPIFSPVIKESFKEKS